MTPQPRDNQLAPVGIGLAALKQPVDGLDRLAWLIDHGVESVQLPLAQRFGLTPESLSGERGRRFRQLIAQFRSPVIHAPFQSVADVTFISPSQHVIQASLAELETVLAIAADSGIRDVVAHSGVKVYWMTDVEAATILQRSLPSIGELAERHGVTIAMETAEWLNSSPALLRLVVKAGLPRVKVCLDIGHLLTPEKGETPLKGYDSIESLIAAFGSQTTVVHIHDTDGKDDHKPLRPDGHLRVESTVAALARAGFDGPYIQELSPTGLSHADLIASARYLEGVIRTVYSAQAGFNAST